MEITKTATPNHSHAWRGVWNRPMNIDENTLDALTVARMTDHNVRGNDPLTTTFTSDEEGHYDIDGVSIVQDKVHKVIVASDANH